MEVLYPGYIYVNAVDTPACPVVIEQARVQLVRITPFVRGIVCAWFSIIDLEEDDAARSIDTVAFNAFLDFGFDGFTITAPYVIVPGQHGLHPVWEREGRREHFPPHFFLYRFRRGTNALVRQGGYQVII